MKKIILLILLVAFAGALVFAHSGRTDKNGCHYNHKTGGYHCH